MDGRRDKVKNQLLVSTDSTVLIVLFLCHRFVNNKINRTLLFNSILQTIYIYSDDNMNAKKEIILPNVEFFICFESYFPPHYLTLVESL